LGKTFFICIFFTQSVKKNYFALFALFSLFSLFALFSVFSTFFVIWGLVFMICLRNLDVLAVFFVFL